MTNANIEPSSAAVELKGVGLKSTHARRQILDIVHTSVHRHMTADDVYRRLFQDGNDVSLATVYRVLSDLEESGLVTRNVFEGGKAVFEINQGHHHDHIICLGCGRVDEFSNETIERLQREVAIAQGYQLADHRLALYGYCAECEKRRRSR